LREIFTAQNVKHCVTAHLGEWVYGRENDGGRWFKKKSSV
jgi:hypothetical protein